MIYVALLRGINVGGKNKVDMKELKAVFEEAGMTAVRTYINSGNVIFSSRVRSTSNLSKRLEKALAANFGFGIRVLVRDLDAMRAVGEALPSGSVNDHTTRCDVMFLWDEADRGDVLDEVTIKPGIDDVQRVAGALIWRIDKENVTKSGMVRLLGTPLYKQMTMRNSNTTRKLLELMEEADRG